MGLCVVGGVDGEGRAPPRVASLAGARRVTARAGVGLKARGGGVVSPKIPPVVRPAVPPTRRERRAAGPQGAQAGSHLLYVTYITLNRGAARGVAGDAAVPPSPRPSPRVALTAGEPEGEVRAVVDVREGLALGCGARVVYVRGQVRGGEGRAGGGGVAGVTARGG